MDNKLLEYLEKLDGKIDDLASATKNDMNVMFNVMKDSFDRVYHRLDNVEERLDTLDESMDDVKTRLTELEIVVENTRSDIRAFGEGNSGNARRIDNLEERVEHLESKAS